MFLRQSRYSDVSVGVDLPTVAQFWDSDEPPADVAREMKVWSDHMGDRYKAFNTKSATDFIADRFGREDAELFLAAPHPAIKADFFRLCLLFAMGGLYVDADARMRAEFPMLSRRMAGKLVLWFQTDRAEGHLTNMMMAAPPGHPLIAKCLETARFRLRETPDAHVYALAGPSVVSDAAIELFARGELQDLHVMSSAFARRYVLTQVPAGYKSDRRNWRIWQVERGKLQ